MAGSRVGSHDGGRVIGAPGLALGAEIAGSPSGKRGYRAAVITSIRLVACDLDGTIIGSDQHISQRTLEVFAKAQDSGIVVVAATGRGPSALPDFGPNRVIDMAICSNGAVVVDLATSTVVERNEIDGANAESLVGDLRRGLPGSCFAWESAEGYGYEEAFARHGQLLLNSLNGAPSIDFDPGSPITKIFVAHSDLGYSALVKRVQDLVAVEVEVTSAGLPFVVITAANVTKASALERLCVERGIAASEVIAFGDSWNDLDMLRWAGTGVAMANANDDVKAAADDQAEAVDGDGVALYLERHLSSG